MTRMTNVITGEVLDTENATVNQVELFKMKACADYVADNPRETIGVEETGMEVTVGYATPQFLITAYTNAIGLLYAESTLNNEWEGIVDFDYDDDDYDDDDYDDDDFHCSDCCDYDGTLCEDCEHNNNDYNDEDDDDEEKLKQAVINELIRLFKESGRI